MAGTKRHTGTTEVDMTGLDGTVGFLLKRAQLAVSRDIKNVFGTFDITAVQFSVLTVVDRNPGMAQRDLALALDVERPRMVPVLDTLERRDLVVRRPDPNDGRSRRIHLTDAGSVLLRELTEQFLKLERRLADRLGEDDLEQLLAALRQLADPSS